MGPMMSMEVNRGQNPSYTELMLDLFYALDLVVILVGSPTSKGLLTIDLVKLLPKSRVEIIDVQRFMGGAPMVKEEIFHRNYKA